ncbi:MAG TPA: GNAT family N-acetyltransferase [Spirochaetota bacterium]|nr:GNAT family N-acetyltransferase [Spirochaetota bacterium]
MKYTYNIKIRNTSMEQPVVIVSADPDLEIVSEWDSIREEILRIERVCYEESLRYSEDEFLEDLRDNGAQFLVLRAGGCIEAFISAAPLHRLDYCAFDQHSVMKDTLYIVSIAVAPAYRNRGYASTMLSQLMTVSRYSRFSAHAIGPASRSMFLSSGFREDENFPGWMGGHDAVYMVRDRIEV